MDPRRNWYVLSVEKNVSYFFLASKSPAQHNKVLVRTCPHTEQPPHSMQSSAHLLFIPCRVCACRVSACWVGACRVCACRVSTCRLGAVAGLALMPLSLLPGWRLRLPLLPGFCCSVALLFCCRLGTVAGLALLPGWRLPLLPCFCCAVSGLALAAKKWKSMLGT